MLRGIHSLGNEDALSEQTDFGYRKVTGEEKRGLVADVFSRVADRYDLMNDLMSLGVHRIWKSAFVSWLNPRPGWHILDVAGGTGDIAREIIHHLHTREDGWRAGSRETRITLADISPEMLVSGKDRGMPAAQPGSEIRLERVCGDAENLPIPDSSVDACTIAFGIRNVTDIPAALSEARRVLRPGGRFMCLEFSRPAEPVLEGLYERWSFDVIPKLGAWIVGDPDSYVYLVESIRRFPDQERFAAMLSAAGLERVRYRNMSGGIVAMHSAWRI